MCGFGIGYGIGRNYQPIRVSVSVSDRNQNSGFGHSLIEIFFLKFEAGGTSGLDSLEIEAIFKQ